LTDSTWLRLAFITIALAAAVYLVRSVWDLAGFAFDVLIVVFLAWILSSAMKRLAKHAQRIVPRPDWAALPLSYLMVLLPLLSLIGLIVPSTLAQAVSLAEDLPIYAERISEMSGVFRDLAESLGLTADTIGGEDEAFVTQIGTAIGRWVQDNAFGILQGATNIGLRIVFILALSVYMVVEGDTITRLFYRLLPTTFHQRVRGILRQLDQTFFSYLRGVSIVAVLYSVTITTVMLVAGLPFALPLGLTSGFVQLVPIVGEVAALGIPILVAFLTQSLTTAVLVTIVLLAWSLFMNNVVLPRVLGNSVRMPGLFVLLAVVLGTRFAGAWGAILGVPVAGFLYSLMLAWIENGSLANTFTSTATSASASESEPVGAAEPSGRQATRPV
jgi:predicted PurR-regulated permease PerM